MSGQSLSRHDLIRVFDDKIAQARNKDTAEALVGTANAVAIMELARQLRVQNLLALAALPLAAESRDDALNEAKNELLGGYTFEEWLAQQPPQEPASQQQTPYAR